MGRGLLESGFFRAFDLNHSRVLHHDVHRAKAQILHFGGHYLQPVWSGCIFIGTHKSIDLVDK